MGVINCIIFGSMPTRTANTQKANDASDSSRSLENATHEPGFDSIFSTRRPKDFTAGLASGLKSFGKGVACGVTGLVAAPIIGASQDGVTGCAKGVAVGVIGAVVLPVAGLGVGTYQGACYTLQLLPRFSFPSVAVAYKYVPGNTEFPLNFEGFQS